MFVYGVCIGPSSRYGSVLKPSLERLGLGPVVTRTRQPSLFTAYNSILDEALRHWPELEGVVLLHEDVQIRDSGFEDRLRFVFADATVGIIGVVGGKGHEEMSWWKATHLYGHVDHATHSDEFTHGTHEVDTVDGLLMALSAQAARRIRLDGRRYPGFHGYDSELCALTRAAGMRVVVTDLNVFHDCKPGPWSGGMMAPELTWAMFEWMIRWRPAPWSTRLVWRVKRAVHAAVAR